MKQMSKKRKTVIIVVGAVLVLGILVGFTGPVMVGGGNGGTQGAAGEASAIRTISLEKGDIQSTVSATGTVYSTNVVEVYSSLSYPVKTVQVSVGDVVVEGDLLAELDSESLEADISQKQASVWASQQSAQQNLASAQQDLEIYKKNVENNYDTNLLSAQSSVDSAKLDLQTAELDVQSANNEVRTARRNLSDARNGEGDYEEAEASDSQMDSLRDAVYSKETALEKAQTNLEKAQQNLEKAEASLEAAKAGSGDSILTYESKVKSAQVNNNFSDQYIAIEKLQSDLEKCTVTAPVSGTVTQVGAVEGAGASGVLFVIQNTDELKVTTSIKEYDIGNVSIGDKVIIKTDATGEREFEGTLTKIAPTSTLSASGNADSSTDAEFEAEVTVKSGVTDMRIGMNARLSIVTEEKTGVFSVPFEAVETVGEQHFIYIEKAGEDGSVTYERLAVEAGLETNLYVEISGEGLAEGMQVVKNASSVDKSLLPETGEPAPQGTPPEADAADTEAADSTGQMRSGADERPEGAPQGLPGEGGMNRA